MSRAKREVRMGSPIWSFSWNGTSSNQAITGVRQSIFSSLLQFTVQDEEDVAEIVGKIRNDINAKIAQRPPDAPKIPVEAEQNLVREAKEFFDKRFRLVKGNYRLVVAALSEKNGVLALRGFDFTLFDNHIKTLRSATDDYKIGAGVYFPADQSKQVAIRLRPISEADARQEYPAAQTW